MYITSMCKDVHTIDVAKDALHGTSDKYCPVTFGALSLRSYLVIYSTPRKIENTGHFAQCRVVCYVCNLIWKLYPTITITAGDEGKVNLCWTCRCEDDPCYEVVAMPSNIRIVYER